MPKVIKEISGVAAKVEALVRPVVESMGVYLWDVRFEQEAGEWYLRVFIEKDTPLDIDTCEAVSRAIDPILDEEDPIKQGYMLEVGGPGLGRKLTRSEHFVRMQGKDILAKLYAPDEQNRKEVRGKLICLDEDKVQMQTEQGEEIIEVQKVSLFKACDDEDLF